MSELRALRRTQEEILSLLRARPASEPAARRAPAPAPASDQSFMDDDPAPDHSHVRSRRRKSVLIIDDDAATRREAVAGFERADVPVTAVAEGNDGLASIAAERPDAIVMELELEGSMAGKDVINMIKATMEWVDIPIVLYTRAQVESQKEARTVHGADDFVIKGPGSAETLVARVIQFFRKG